MKTCIIAGGMIEEDFALPFIQRERFDRILAADRGLAFCRTCGIAPDCAIGDFDSLAPDILERYRAEGRLAIREFDPVKDYTDSDLALEQALAMGSSSITVLGATGGRLDHFLSNLQNLKKAWKRGVPACLVDSRNRISIPVSRAFALRRADQFGTYVSFFPLEEKVTGLTLAGFRYPLTDAELVNDSGGLAVSNEITEETARVQYRDGILLMIESRD